VVIALADEEYGVWGLGAHAVRPFCRDDAIEGGSDEQERSMGYEGSVGLHGVWPGKATQLERWSRLVTKLEMLNW
jgi:hypothetical protein